MRAHPRDRRPLSLIICAIVNHRWLSHAPNVVCMGGPPRLRVFYRYGHNQYVYICRFFLVMASKTGALGRRIPRYTHISRLDSTAIVPNTHGERSLSNLGARRAVDSFPTPFFSACSKISIARMPARPVDPTLYACTAPVKPTQHPAVIASQVRRGVRWARRDRSRNPRK